MQQEMKCCAEFLAQQEGERHFLLSDLNDLQQGAAKCCVGNVIVPFRTLQICVYRFFLSFVFFSVICGVNTFTVQRGEVC